MLTGKKMKCSERKLSQCHLTYHKSNMDWPWIEMDLRGERSDTNSLSEGTALWWIMSSIAVPPASARTSQRTQLKSNCFLGLCTYLTQNLKTRYEWQSGCYHSYYSVCVGMHISCVFDLQTNVWCRLRTVWNKEIFVTLIHLFENLT